MPLIICVYSRYMLNVLLTNHKGSLRVGDGFDLVTGNGPTKPVDPEAVNNWQAVLSGATGLNQFWAHTAGLAHAEQLLTAGLTAGIQAVAYDYEINYEPEFTWDGNQARGMFDRFSALCHSHGRLAVGYPTGRALLGTFAAGRFYTWDYGALAGRVDHLAVQTQGPAKDPATFRQAITRLVQQFSESGQALSKLTVQATVGGLSVNATSPEVAAEDLSIAAAAGISSFYVWWAADDSAALQQFFALIGR